MLRPQPRTRRLLQTAAVALAVVLTSPGCKVVQRLFQKNESDTVAVNSATPEQAGLGLEEADYEMSEKISAHIDCLNFASRDAFHARRSYLRSIDGTRGPTGKENGVWLGSIDVTRCATGLTKAKSLKPTTADLDQVSDAYLVSLQKLGPLVKAASSYYEQKDYKDDAWAKAKQMHPGLMAAFADFDKAHQAFDDKVKSINEGLSERRLQRLKQDPSAQLEYLAAKVIADAKPLLKFTDISQIKQLDEVGYKPALDQYEATAAEYERYVEAHPDESSKVIAMSIFRSQVSALLKSAKELMRNKQGGKEVESMSPELSVGHPANVVKEFNELISRSNGMTFRR